MTENIIQDIKGSDAVINWFGYWPDFHDAEIVELHLNRQHASWIKIYFWKNAGVDEQGHGVLVDHVILTFFFDEISDLELSDFSPQNVINELSVSKNGNDFRLTMEPCYGVAGFIEGALSRIEISPGELTKDTLGG